MRTKKTKREVAQRTPAKKPAAPAPKPKTPVPAPEPQHTPSLSERIISALPVETLAKLELALKTGRYLLFVARLDSDTNMLEFHRHMRDFRNGDHQQATDWLTRDLQEARDGQ